MKRVIISEQAGVLTGTNAYEEKEFLTSTDERFRPVMAATGPDGALYVVDLYRGMLQHPAFLTHYLAANIKARKLETPSTKVVSGASCAMTRPRRRPPRSLPTSPRA